MILEALVESCSICGAVTDTLASNRPLHKGRAATLLICRECVAGARMVFVDAPETTGNWRLIMADCAWCGSAGVAVSVNGDYAICEDCASICTDSLSDDKVAT